MALLLLHVRLAGRPAQLRLIIHRPAWQLAAAALLLLWRLGPCCGSSSCLAAAMACRCCPIMLLKCGQVQAYVRQ